jgi:uncharacterized protein YcnI
MPTTLPIGRALAALGAGALLAVAVPLSASAHVTLTQNTASPGSSVILTFKVPNESADGATTTALTVSLPTDHPLVSVRFVPQGGWTATATTEKLPEPVKKGDDTITQAVTKVTWTAADGGGIPVGGLGLFQLQVGPIPDVGRLSLPADQTYSDGSVVSWSETTANAQHPAPVLYVNDAPPAAPGSTPSASPVAQAQPTDGSSSSGDADVIARVIGILGLVVGAVGLVVGIAGMSGRRRKEAA